MALGKWETLLMTATLGLSLRHSIMRATGAIFALALASAVGSGSAAAGIPVSHGPENQAQNQGATPKSVGKKPVPNYRVIDDKAEFNAYLSAFNTPDPAQKAAGLEAFATQYPQSPIKIDALELAMNFYEQVLNMAKVEEIANRVLQLDSENLRALEAVTSLKRNRAVQDPTPALVNEVSQLGQKGLAALPNWEPTQVLTEAEAEKLRKQMTVTFADAASFAAMHNEDYAGARKFYEQALHSDPNNLQNLYHLASAHLEPDPIDPIGFWYCGKAIYLAQKQKPKIATAETFLSTYCKGKYQKRAGNLEGWDQIVRGTAKDSYPPPDFAKGLPISKKDGALSKSASAQAPLPNPAATLSEQRISEDGTGIGAGPGTREPTIVAPMSGKGVSPRLLLSPDPQFPESARDGKIQGVEILKVLVGTDGRVKEARVMRSLSPAFDEAAITAVKQWKFSPASKDGEPVAAWSSIEITFHLDPSSAPSPSPH